MSPNKSELLIPIVISIILYVIVFIRTRKKMEDFVLLTWFKRKTNLYQFKKFLYLIGISLLLVSLLDFRGPEQKIESDIPDQKTIVIIDSSASMLAEDIRPNRFQKSLIMARHFVKKAFGHKIAVVLFSDQQKRLVPFTDDLDLLDARIAGLENVDLYDGGSNISQAIKESLGYFKNASSKNENLIGNILVFTDSEGHDEDFTFSLPKTVNLAVVGVGTLQGSKIPFRDKNGIFRGYKKHQNKEIVTKLNEQWLKSLKSKVDNYNYWIANSYSIPTEEIMSFFNSSFEKTMSKGLTTVQPVEVEYVLIPAMLILIISFLFYPAQYFKYILIGAILFPLNQEPVQAQLDKMKEGKNLTKEQLKKEKEEIELLNKLMTKHKQGLVSKKEKMKMAELLTKNENVEMANMIYSENKNVLSPKDRNNYAYSLIKEKKAGEAIQILSELQLESETNSKIDDELKKIIRQNMLLALKKDKQQKEEKKKEEEEKKKQEQQKNKEGGSGNENKKEKDSSGKKSSEGKGSPDKENQEKKKEEKNKDSDKENKKENNSEKKSQEEKESKPKTLKEKMEEIERKRKMVKIPGLIKQLMSDDRNLQKKYIDTSTDKPKSFQKKDW